MINKRMLAIQIGLLFFLGACSGGHRPREKEKAAVQLLGTATREPFIVRIPGDMRIPVEEGGIEAEMRINCGSSERDPKVAEATKIVREWFGEDKPALANLGDGLHETAKKLASLLGSCSKMEVKVETTGMPSVEKIREILGKEDEVKSSNVQLEKDLSVPI